MQQRNDKRDKFSKENNNSPLHKQQQRSEGKVDKKVFEMNTQNKFLPNKEKQKYMPNVFFSKKDIMSMEYEKLYENIEQLQRYIKKGRQSGFDTTNLEIECSYLEHEIFLRQNT